ncbi:MAG: DMT family transporter [Pseudomonadota bacterium]
MANLRGIVLMIIAMGCFAVSDAFLKVLTQTVPRGQILIIFGLAGGILLGTVATLRGARLFGPWFLRPVFLTRLAADMFAATAIVSAFALASLSLVSAIMQVSPLVAALTAAWLLGERVGPWRLGAIGIGLLGVLIILEPWGERIELGAIFAAVGACLLALRDVLTRKMPDDTPYEALVTYGILAMAPGGLILFLADPAWVPVAPGQGALFAAGILSGILGYTTITLASRMAEISAIAPFRYSRLVFALLIGGIAFGERLPPHALFGAALVIGTGLFVFWREARLRGAQSDRER